MNPVLLKKSEIYLGNNKLKKAGVTVDYTEEQLSELVRCSNDIDYFCHKYMKIVNIDEGIVPLDVYDFQKWNPNTIIHKIENANHVFGVSHPFNDKNFPSHFNELLDETFNFLKT